ncbi:MAG: ATP-binding cassette domain-containing protein [Gemmatimonadetes bacterium]|nr:ATP-binding cassette domain-containing protein [Gemmatimonadota bacterium]
MTPTAERAVVFSDVRFRYRTGSEVLSVDRFEIGTGERVFLHGPSGSGKTTLLGLVAGVLPATAGRVEVLGRALGDLRPSERDAHRGVHIGYLFQLFNLIPWLSVEENIGLPCRLHAARRARLPGGSIERAVAQLAERLAIVPLLGQRVNELSVGQQQRVAAARALIGAPRLVIADEPTSAIDTDLRDRFIELLFSQCAEAGSSLLFVSHDLSLSARFDRSVSLPAINRVTA